MAQSSVGQGQSQGEVDWDAVFRTIDHQQGQGTNVAVAVNVNVDGVGGTLQNQSGETVEYPPWSTVPEPVHARRGPGNEEDQSDAELLEYFGQQWNHGGPSQHRRDTVPRTMDPTSGLGYGVDSASGGRPSTGHANETYDIAFKAMLGGPDDNEGMVPPPQTRSLRGRRRSHSMGPRRALSDIQTGIGPYTGPLTSYPSFPHHDLPSNGHTPFTMPPAMPPALIHSNPDVYPFFPNPQSHNASAGPSTPAPTPSNYYPQPTGASNRQSISTSGADSQRPTPLNSAQASPQALASTFSHYGNREQSNGQGSGSEPTPGTELDSEDKRARNTLASARFRAKRKAHINDVERQITQLESQSTTIAKQVADLRKENGFLKDMVQLKYGLDVDKRM